MKDTAIRAQIQLEIVQKQEELDSLKAELHQLDFDEFVRATGIRVGSVVRCRNGKLWTVERIEPYCDGEEAWVYGRYHRDDGVLVKRAKLVSDPRLAE